jgi:5-methylcytosine-specific restriction enzyme subunit McrC
LLSEEEYRLLQNEMPGRLRLERPVPNEYWISPTHYVGNIVLPNHYIIIRPKVRVNFFRMLYFTPDLLPEFKRSQFEYAKADDIYEIIIGRFLEEIEGIAKHGISRGYEENEENLRTVKQRILVLQNIRENSFLKDKVYCRFTDFTSDVPENRIVKCALYQISRMPLRDPRALRRTRHLLRHLEQVRLIATSAANLQQVHFSRLNEHYRIVVSLGKLIIEHCTLNLQTGGRIRYASYLVDMNALFQKFLYSYLRDNLKDYSVAEEPKYEWDKEGRFALYPDIVVKKSGKDVLAIDAKWKRRQNEDEQPKTITDDLKQMYLYCQRLKIPVGILVYPKHEVSPEHEQPVRLEKNITLLTKAIDLRKEKEEFDYECNRFVSEIEGEIKDILHSQAMISSPDAHMH